MKNKPINIDSLTVIEAKKEFDRQLSSLAYSKGVRDVFSDFLDFSLMFFNLSPSDEQKEWHSKLEQEKKDAYLIMFECYGAMAENFHDPLGDIFMEHISHGHNSQFFTPEPMCDMMSRIIAIDELQNGQSVCDPTCGSGRMLLAAGKIAREKNKHLHYYGSDIDGTCCRMSLLNMLVNTLDGEIARMDTLRMEHYKSYVIQRMQLPNGYYLCGYNELPGGTTGFIQKLENSMKQDNEQSAFAEMPQQEITDKHGQLLLF